MDFNAGGFKIHSEELEKALGVPSQEIPPPCPHEEAFTEFYKWMGKELAEAEGERAIGTAASNIYAVVSYQRNMGSCIGWVAIGENFTSPHPDRPDSFHKLVAKYKEVDAEVTRKEAELDEQEQSNET